jgi:hypothetical protein
MNYYAELVEWELQGKAELLRAKPISEPLCPPGSRTSSSRGQRLIAWATARPNGKMSQRSLSRLVAYCYLTEVWQYNILPFSYLRRNRFLMNFDEKTYWQDAVIKSGKTIFSFLWHSWVSGKYVNKEETSSNACSAVIFPYFFIPSQQNIAKLSPGLPHNKSLVYRTFKACIDTSFCVII